MTLAIQNNMAALLLQKSHRFCTCWKIERVDGQAFYFTDHPHDLVLDDGFTYTPVGGFDTSAQHREESFEEKNREARGVISSAAITTDDLRAGLYRNAKVTEQVVDWRYAWAGAFESSVYWIAETRFDGEAWQAEISGISIQLQHRVGDVFNRTCKYDLGEGRFVADQPGCKQDRDPDSSFGVSVATVTDRANFTFTNGDIPAGDQSTTGWYDEGEMLWKTGNNSGLTTVVRAYVVSTGPTVKSVELYLPMPFDIQAGDTCNVYVGCDKTFTTCGAKFANTDNFGGHPHIPGADAVFRGPTA